jgi:hypothetical protein
MSVITAEQSAALTLLAEQNLLTDSIAAAILGSPAPKGTDTATARTLAARKAAPKAPKASRKQTTTPKAAKPAKKAATIAAAAKPQTARSLDTTPGSITKGQTRRIVAVSDQHGFEILDMSQWSMATASTYYADLKAAI